MGFGGKNPFKWFQYGVDSSVKQKIENLINQRAVAKKEKNYQLADSIRDKLSEMGVVLMDMGDKTEWEKVRSSLAF